MKKIKLTIGIPTYNGARYIEQTIDSVLSQLDGIDKGVIEILVCDNASEDHVWQIAIAYKEKFPKLFSIFQNETNVGFDRNVDSLFRYAQGDFVWPLADDDVISQDSIRKVLSVLKSNPEVGLLFVGGAQNLVGLSEGVFCNDGNDFLQITAFGSGGVSANVIKKLAWNSVKASRFFDTGWIHLGVTLEVVINY
jgi:glycosyltransferase involved in cell wall biosynthesis